MERYHRPLTEFAAMTVREKAAVIAVIDMALEAEEKTRKDAERKIKKR